MRIAHLDITPIKFEKAVQAVIEMSLSRMSSYTCFVNAHMVVEAWKDKSFAEQVNRANFVFSDGKPITWAMRFLHGVRQERIAGMDFMPAFLQKCHEHHLSVFFYGSSQNILEGIKKQIESELPNCKVVGMISPPFRPLSSVEQEEYIQKINDAKPHAVFVALGCPKQEKWCAENSPKINAVLLPVGGAFPVYARVQSRAPKMMQKCGLEWFYRLCQEPNRLWKRYLITNTLFLWGVVLQKIKLL